MSHRRTREVAREVVDDLQAVAPRALRLGSIDLSGALEQSIYMALPRGGPHAASMSGPRSVARIVRAVLAGRRSAGGADGAAVLVAAQQPIHLGLYAPVDAELRRRGTLSRTVDVVQAGPAADERLGRALSLRGAMMLSRHAMTVRSDLRVGSRRAGRDGGLSAAARDILVRLAVQAAQLDSVVARVRPACLVTFNEIGIWSRLGPAVARANEIPAIDLPHAEAADAEAIEGLPHDAIAVYGPRSAEVMARAGVDPSRIYVIGPLRYDSLAERARQTVRPDDLRRILYASQPIRPALAHLTREAKREVYAAALAAAGTAAPSTLFVVPHPTEPTDELRAIIDGIEAPAGVTVIQDAGGLHDLLIGSTLLVTAASQSVFDAAVAGVPALMVHPAETPSPVPYAAEGFAIEVRDAREAAATARRLLSGAGREEALQRARRALADRFGHVDGRAHVRAADLIQSLASSAGSRP